jgi:uncharacterized Ntn-hydrolase superfamily protein
MKAQQRRSKMRRVTAILFWFGTFLAVVSEATEPDGPLAHTYSIVAGDPTTGHMALGVQSHWFSVGSVVSWGEAGVGVVATQSFVNKSFGVRGLELLKKGLSPKEALDRLLAEDEGRDFRQVAILDAKGRVAAFTGKKCIDHAGHYVGNGYSVQSNMMLTDKVVAAMAEAFDKNTSLSLPERVIAAMEAAEQSGGDIRGRQSAALLVVSGSTTDRPWEEPLIDLRVDDAGDPLVELKRLLSVHRAYEHMNRGDLAVEKGDMETATREYKVAEGMFPANLEMKYWHAITLANHGNLDHAVQMLADIYQKDAQWRELTRRLPKCGLLTLQGESLERVLNAGKSGGRNED